MKQFIGTISFYDNSWWFSYWTIIWIIEYLLISPLSHPRKLVKHRTVKGSLWIFKPAIRRTRRSSKRFRCCSSNRRKSSKSNTARAVIFTFDDCPSDPYYAMYPPLPVDPSSSTFSPGMNEELPLFGIELESYPLPFILHPNAIQPADGNVQISWCRSMWIREREGKREREYI